MAPEWEMGMEFGMGAAANYSPTFPTAAASPSPAYFYGLPSSDDSLRIDDLLNFSNHDFFPSSHNHLPPPDSSASAGRPFDVESGSSSDHRPQFTTLPDDLYIPSEEAAELEWLSKFVEDSFSDIPYPSSATDLLAAGNVHIRSGPSSVPGRGARSKRSRAAAAATAAAATWTSLAPPPPQTSSSSTTSSSSSSDFPPSKPELKKGASAGEIAVGVRRCTHCSSEKTPQWRTGPLGPKTLCNACGVRYKSGRLVPEYRPATSPTFVLTQHSNSHRKVMELRRQKEFHLLRHDNHPATSSSSSYAAASRPDLLFHDYEVC